jgi:hypothetical protein
MLGTGRQTDVVFPIYSGTVGIQGQSQKIDLKGASLVPAIVAIIYGVVSGSVPSLDRSMFQFTTTVTWPYMKQFEIQKVGLPSAVRITGDPKLLN